MIIELSDQLSVSFPKYFPVLSHVTNTTPVCLRLSLAFRLCCSQDPGAANCCTEPVLTLLHKLERICNLLLTTIH